MANFSSLLGGLAGLNKNSSYYNTKKKSNNQVMNDVLGYSNVKSSAPFNLVNPNPLASTSSISNVNKQNASYLAPTNNTNNQNASYLPLNTNNSVEQSTSNSSVSSSGSYSGGGGASVSTPAGIDLSDILAAYTASAEAQKKSISDAAAARRQLLADTLTSNIKTLETSESQQRENLLNSLKRFQEDTAKARGQQQSSFNASRADLEAQAFMANRAAMQSAAARGLGGSGLQQLSQLQNMINQSGEINKLSLSNTEALNALAQELARQEEDTTTNINNLAKEIQNKKEALTTEQKNTLNALLSEEANKLNEIETNTTSLKEQLKYQEAVRAENARIEAEQFAAQLAASNAASSSSFNNYLKQLEIEEDALRKSGLNTVSVSTKSGIDSIVNAYNNAVKAKKSPEKTNQAVSDAYQLALAEIRQYAINAGLAATDINSYENQLKNFYSQYYKG